VVRLAKLAGEHALDAHAELVAFSPRTREVPFDEMWAFVGKKPKNCDSADPDDDHKGDWWDHVAFDPEHTLVLAVVPGARDRRHAGHRLRPRLESMEDRTLLRKLDASVTSDAPDANKCIGAVELGPCKAHSDHPFRRARSGSRESIAMRASSRTPKVRPGKTRQVELLEDRQLLATIIVNTTADDTATG
jgi:hypothetical protein